MNKFTLNHRFYYSCPLIGIHYSQSCLTVKCINHTSKYHVIMNLRVRNMMSLLGVMMRLIVVGFCGCSPVCIQRKGWLFTKAFLSAANIFANVHWSILSARCFHLKKHPSVDALDLNLQVLCIVLISFDWLTG